MSSNSDLIISSLTSANSALILLPQNPPLDATAAALSLQLALDQNGKSAKVVCPTPATAGQSRLVGVDKISDQIGNKNLIISFNVPEEAIEKVSYNYDQGKLNFIVEPASGYVAPSKDKVSFSYSGIDADIIILIGVRNPMDLGKLQDNPDIANHANQHNLGLNPDATSFNSLPQVSYSLLAAQVIEGLGYPLDEDSATNILFGIDNTTHNLTQSITPEILETAAKCLRSGAIRHSVQINQSRAGNENRSEIRYNPNQNGKRHFSGGPRRRGFMPPRSFAPQNQNPIIKNFPPQFQQQPVNQQPSVNISQNEQDVESPIDPSPDWFEPKIYKGSTLI